jgi:phage terminase small subunit
MKHRRRLTTEQRQHLALTVGDRRFVEEYLVDLNAKEASLRAGLQINAGGVLLGHPRIQLALARERARRQTRTEIYADEVLRRWWLLARADAREFTQIRRVNCRRCWGRNHQHQFRDHELIEAEMLHEVAQRKRAPQDRTEFNDLGGGGFDGYAEPCRGAKATERLLGMGITVEPTSDHDCPACDGLGEVTVWVNDSRHYTPAGAILYDGVKVSKDGSIEVKLRDRQHAEDMVAQHLGMLVQRQAILTIDPTQLSDDQLNAAIQQFDRMQGKLIEHEDSEKIADENEDEDSEEVVDAIENEVDQTP